eukprot:maker-scaffold_6-augustus-gene-10.0-mRNA-1 protein AED:0.22 eAED:0.22 QI:0/0/0.5/1/0/0.5/2/83/597
MDVSDELKPPDDTDLFDDVVVRIPKLFLTISKSLKPQDVISKPRWQINNDDPVSKQLVIDLIRGRNLLAKDRNGMSDPFVRVNFQGRNAKSQFQRYTLNPDWKQRIDFPFTKYDEFLRSKDKENDDFVLEFEVFDKDRFSVDPMGVAQLYLTKLPLIVNKSSPIFLPVFFQGKQQGHLEIVITILNPINPKPVIPRFKKPKGKLYHFEEAGEMVLEKKKFGVMSLHILQGLKTATGHGIYLSMEIMTKPEWFILKEPTSAPVLKSTNAHLRLAFKVSLSPNVVLPNQLLTRKPIEPLHRRDHVSIRNFRPFKYHIDRLMLYKTNILISLRLYSDLVMWKYGTWNTIGFMLGWAFFTLTFRTWYLPFSLGCFLIYTYQSKHYFGHTMEVDEQGLIVDGKTLNDSAMAETDNETLSGDEQLQKKEIPVIGDSPEEFDDSEEGVEETFKRNLLDKIGVTAQAMKKASGITEDLADYYERIVGLFCWSNRSLTAIIFVMLGFATIALMFIPLNLILCLGMEYQFIKNWLSINKYAFLKPKYPKGYFPILELLKRVPTERERELFAKVRKENGVELQLNSYNLALQDKGLFVHKQGLMSQGW